MTIEQLKHPVTHLQKRHSSNELQGIFYYKLLNQQQKKVESKSLSNMFLALKTLEYILRKNLLHAKRQIQTFRLYKSFHLRTCENAIDP